MNIRNIVLTALALLSLSTPAWARQGRHNPTFPVPRHLTMVPVECDSENYFDLGAFFRFTNRRGQHLATWGTADAGSIDMGFNVYPTGLPAKNFQLDWDLSQSVDPYFCIIISTSGGTEYWICYSANNNPGGNGRINLGLPQGFTTQLLSNGFTRIKFDAAANGVPAGAFWNKVDCLDYFVTDSGQDTVTNMFVNGIPVVPDTHAPTNPPVLDCSQ